MIDQEHTVLTQTAKGMLLNHKYPMKLLVSFAINSFASLASSTLIKVNIDAMKNKINGSRDLTTTDVLAAK